MDADRTRALLGELTPALQQRRSARIFAIASELVAGQAEIGKTWRSLAMVLAHSLHWKLALAASELHLRQVPPTAAAVVDHANLLRAAGRFDEALRHIARIPAGALPPGVKDHFTGSLLTVLGRPEEAEPHLISAVRAAPGAAHFWFALVGNGSAAKPAIRDMVLQAAAMRDRMDAPGVFDHALGDVLHAQGDHSRAFAAYARAGQTLRRERPYEHAAIEREFAAATAANSADAIARINAQVAADTTRPILVTGLPRSGTTLVEQVLASHSAVADGAELGLFRVVAEDAGTMDSVPLAAGSVSFAALSQLYLDLLAERFPAEGRIVDKTLVMSRPLGLAAALLPDAPLVWVTRDPVENGWSAFRTYFRTGHAWSCDLADTARFIRTEQRYLAFWQEVLGDRLLVLSHEALVADPQGGIARLLAHCNLAPEAACFEPHKTERAVVTASALQVRRPIGAGTSGGAGPYREWLGPLMHGLS